MSLEALLVTDLVKYFDSQNYKSFKGIKAPTEYTNKKAFGLMDKEDPFIVEEANGSVTYKNDLQKNICITNYEEFINSLPKSLQIGKKRCDFLVYQDDNNSFFILNELSQSRNIDAKESDALYQLQNTLENLCSVDTIKSIINSCRQRLCVFSNKVKPVEAPLGMTAGFNMTYSTVMLDAITFEFDGINIHGFEYYRANCIDIGESIKLKNC